MFGLLGEGSSDSDGPVSVRDEDRATVHDLLSPDGYKAIPPTKAPRSI